MAKTTVYLGLVFEVLFGFVKAPIALGASTHHVALRVSLPTSEVVDAYALKPSNLVTPNGWWGARWAFARTHRENSSLSARVLKAAADFIDAESVRLGYVNPQTLSAHSWELEQIRSGAWPGIVITKPGNPEAVLYTVFVAPAQMTAGGESRLPFERRFFHLGVLQPPRGPAAGHWQLETPEMNYAFPIFLPDFRTGKIAFDLELSKLFSSLPWIVGGSAEIKHLFQAPSFAGSLSPIGHALMQTYGLYRESLEELPWPLRKAQREIMLQPEFKTLLRENIAELEKERIATAKSNGGEDAAKVVRSFFEGLRKALWNRRGFQRRRMISTIYAQTSAPDGASSRVSDRLYLNHFGFPKDPFKEFLESSSRGGTDGIRTKIFALDLLGFDFDTGLALTRSTEVLPPNVVISRLPQARSCPSLLIQPIHDAFAASVR